MSDATITTSLRKHDGLKSGADTNSVRHNIQVALKLFCKQAEKHVQKGNLKKGEDVLLTFAEDEVPLRPTIQYDYEEGRFLGLCGMRGDDHKCSFEGVYKFGGDWTDTQKLNYIIHLAINGVQGSYGHAVMANPITPHLSPITILFCASCNRFDANPTVRNGQAMVRHLFLEEISRLADPPVNFVVGGNAADGDARKFLLMLYTSYKLENEPVLEDGTEKVYQLPAKTFSKYMSFRIRACAETGRSIEVVGLSNQDHKHNTKKLAAQLWAKSSQIMIGGDEVSINHLKHAVETKKLTRKTFERTDRQNFIATLDVSSDDVIADLKEEQKNGSKTAGCAFYLTLIRMYTLLYHSELDSLEQRVKNCGFIAGALRRMRLSILRNGNRTVKDNFMPNQTYRHVLFEVHQFTNLVIFCWLHKIPFYPEFLGSDCCEKLFSFLGGWGSMCSWSRDFSTAQSISRIRTLAKLEFLSPNGWATGVRTGAGKTEFDPKYFKAGKGVKQSDDGFGDWRTAFGNVTFESLACAWDRGDGKAKNELGQLGAR